MYANANELQAGATMTGFDICIAGAGAAGIAMAQRLIGSSKKVLLLVNGSSTDAGPEPDESLQQLYGGTLGPFMTRVGPNFLTRSRLNMYGGTTNHFSFNARPLDAADLLPRPGYRSACWPVTMETLNSYYDAANEFGNYGPSNYNDLAFWGKVLNGEPFPPGDSLQSIIMHSQAHQAFYPCQARFGYALEAASNVTVLFQAQVLAITATPDNKAVAELRCAAIDNGERGIDFQTAADAYVLALGGIEPVRLLKLSGNLGDNSKGHLGRGFMLHPLIALAAQVTFAPPVDTRIQHFYTRQTVTLGGSITLDAWGAFAPTPEAMLRERMGAFHANLSFGSGNIGINWESVPHENSTLTLDPNRVDPVFGQPVAHLDWQMQDTEKHTVVRGLELLEQYLRSNGASDFSLNTNLSGGPDQWTFSPDLSDPAALQAGDHHMGALRMSASPDGGIVDADCKVHTLSNLYIAGSGVFPTTGHGNPTLTIVALALRLADHLNAQP